MFTSQFSQIFLKKVEKIAKKDKVLVHIIHKKVQEILQRDEHSIQLYKNLRSPFNDFKRIHLTDQYIILFVVKKTEVTFVDIRHRDFAYK